MTELMPLMAGLARQTLWLSGWIVLVALLRPGVTRVFGAPARLGLWALVPLGWIVLLLPAPATPLAPLVLWQMPGELTPPWVTAAPLAVGGRLIAGGTVTAVILATVWCLGVAGGGLLMIRQQQRYLARLHWDAARQCWRSPAGTSPAEAGLWRRHLVLPADFEQRFSPAEQALVLAHEACHHQRRDNAWRLLALVIAWLHWFNPLVWWALSRLRQDQELACDAAVLGRHPRQRASYLQALLKSHLPPSPVPWAASAWSRTTSPHPLIERVQMLPHHLRHHHRRHWGLGLIAAFGLVSAGLVYAQQGGSPTATARPVLVSMNLLVNGRPAGSPQVLVNAGETAAIGIDARDKIADATPWRLSLRVDPQADGQLRLSTQISGGEPLSARGEPSFVTEPGKPIEFFVRDASGQQILQVREMTVQWAPAR